MTHTESFDESWRTDQEREKQAKNRAEWQAGYDKGTMDARENVRFRDPPPTTWGSGYRRGYEDAEVARP